MPYICRMGYLLALLIGAALVTAMVWKPAPPPKFAGISGRDVPQSVGGYVSGADDPVPADTQAVLASATLTSRTFQAPPESLAPDPLNFVLIGGTDRSALHDPRSCLIGSGMEVQNDHLELLPGTQIQARSCRAMGGMNADGGTNSGGFDIIYLYLVNGHIVNQATQIRAAMLWSALLGQRGTPVYFLRFTRSIHSDPRLDAAGHAAMLHFASDMWTRLQSKLMSATGTRKGSHSAQQNYSRECRVS